MPDTVAGCFQFILYMFKDFEILGSLDPGTSF